MKLNHAVYVSRKPVFNVLAETKAEAVKKAQKKYPGFRVLHVRVDLPETSPGELEKKPIASMTDEEIPNKPAKPIQYTKKLTKAQVKAAIRHTGEWTGRILPCKANPYSPWHDCRGTMTFTTEKDFEDFLSEFEYYNCQTNELGRYAAYYGADL
jgi:hypothetical protein